MLRQIRAAGGVLWRPAASGAAGTDTNADTNTDAGLDGDKAVEVLLVHRPRYDDWSLPKGKAERGEHLLHAAVREVWEESGVRPVVDGRLTTVRYPVPAGPKTVDFWAMRPAGSTPAGDAPRAASTEEIDTVEWVRLDLAGERVSYDTDREVLAAFGERPRGQVTVLLVRHASAGDRSDWDGEDTARPLDSVGAAQARELAVALPAFAPEAIFTADRLRCAQTVAPLADALGLPVRESHLVSEEGYWADPSRAEAFLRQLLLRDSCTVVCSQGGAIPSLVATFTAEAGISLDRVRSRKGSVWALSVHNGRLVGADYYRDVRPD